MVVALLYAMQSPCNCFYIIVETIVGETTMMLRWRSRCRAGDVGDHDDALVMEIMSTR